jgi:hypothetical protein
MPHRPPHKKPKRMKIVVKIDNKKRIEEGLEPSFPPQAILDVPVNDLTREERGWLAKNGFFSGEHLVPRLTPKTQAEDVCGFSVETLDLLSLKASMAGVVEEIPNVVTLDPAH